MSDKNDKISAAIKTSIGGQALIEGIMMARSAQDRHGGAQARRQYVC